MTDLPEDVFVEMISEADKKIVRSAIDLNASIGLLLDMAANYPEQNREDIIIGVDLIVTASRKLLNYIHEQAEAVKKTRKETEA